MVPGLIFYGIVVNLMLTSVLLIFLGLKSRQLHKEFFFVFFLSFDKQMVRIFLM